MKHKARIAAGLVVVGVVIALSGWLADQRVKGDGGN